MKKTISLILCLAMVLSFSTYIFAGNKTINYVSLGSSQSLGYGLSGLMHDKFLKWEGTEKQISDWENNKWDADAWDPAYMEKIESMIGWNSYGFKREIDGSFSSLIKERLEKSGYTVNFSQLAMAAMRPNDLCWYLYDDYEPDYYDYAHYLGENNLFYQLTGYTDTKGLMFFQDEYRTALKDADLITYDLGSNNFGTGLVSLVDGTATDLNFEQLVGKYNTKVFETAKNTIILAVSNLFKLNGLEDFDLSKIEYYIDALAYCYIGYCAAFDKSMEWIYKNNSDVTVVVMQIQNFFEGFDISIDGIDLPVGDIVNIIISMANTYASSLSPYCNKYYYANLKGQRVRFVIDDIAEYTGPKDMKDIYKEALDTSYSPYNIKTLLASSYLEAGGSLGDVRDDEYYEILDSCYDAGIKLIKYIYDNCELDIKGNLSYGMSKEYGEILTETVNQITNDVLKGKDNSSAVKNAFDKINALSPELQSQILLKVVFVGTIELIHPSEEGYEEMARAALNALYTHKKGLPSIISNLQINKTSIVNSVKQGVKTVVESVIKTAITNISPCKKTTVLKKCFR